MKIPIKLNYYPYINFLIIKAICFGLRKIIEIQCFKEIKPLFIMFLGESFSLFVYLYQKFILLKNEKKKQFKPKKRYDNIQKIILILFLSSICDLLGCDETIININTNNILNSIFLSIFIVLNEYILLKIPKYNYHFLGISLYITSMIIEFFSDLKFSIKMFILSFELQYSKSLFYIMEKYLNHIYFMKITSICFWEGIFGMIILTIYFLFSKSQFYESLFPNNNNHFFIILLYCILTCIGNLSRLRVTELSLPSYNLIGNSLCSLTINIADSISNKKDKWDITNILVMSLSLLASFIFVEVITFNCFDLDKYTSNSLIDRGILETQNILDSSTITN